MNQTFGITRTLLIVTLIGAILVAGLAMRAQQLASAGLDRASKEGLFWSAVQVEVELSRFTAALGRYAIRDEAISAEQVNERFDILWSRVALFRQGDVGERLVRLDEAEVVAALFAEMQARESAVVGIETLDAAGVRGLVGAFSAYGDRLRALSIRVIRAEENRLAEVRVDVRRASNLTLLATASVLAIVALLSGVLLVESRRYRRMAEESAAFAREADAASRMKSRFLTMMSHELRTPMNGVMGMLALVRQTQLSDPQIRLIDQAQRSGSQMVMLLNDMLDLSDLQSDRQNLSLTNFSPGDLGSSLAAQLAQRIERAGLGFRVETDPEAPRTVSADFQRIRQVVTHIAVHLIDVVGSPELVMRLGYREDHLVIELDAAVHGRDRAGWQPEEMLSRPEDEYGSFASEALAPMIAEGLIGLMDGRIEIRRGSEHRASVFIELPAEVVEAARHLVRIDVASPALKAMLSALLKGADWPIADPGGRTGEAAATAAVFFSSDGREEAEAVPPLRAAYPNARIIAVGVPQHPELFDAIVGLPLTQVEIVSILNEKGRAEAAS